MKKNFSSQDFIEKLKILDPEATEEIIRAYTSHLYKAGLGAGISKEGSEEVANATWVTFFEVVKRFEGRSHIRTFLFGIFYNKVSEYRRTRIKIEKCDPIEDIHEQSFISNGHYKQHQLGPEQYLHGKQVMSIIDKCLDHLPITQRLVFTMKIVEEQDTRDICNTLNITDTNLRQLLFRAKNRLKLCVDKCLKGGNLQ